MKKLARGILFLLLFGVFILATQISCTKSIAGPTGTTTITPINKILFMKQGVSARDSSYRKGGGDTTIITVHLPAIASELWYCSIDGSGSTKVNLILPTNLTFGPNASFSADGTMIIFNASDNTTYVSSIYSVNLDGSSLKLLQSSASNGNRNIILGDVK